MSNIRRTSGVRVLAMAAGLAVAAAPAWAQAPVELPPASEPAQVYSANALQGMNSLCEGVARKFLQQVVAYLEPKQP